MVLRTLCVLTLPAWYDGSRPWPLVQREVTTRATDFCAASQYLLRQFCLTNAPLRRYGDASPARESRPLRFHARSLEARIRNTPLHVIKLLMRGYVKAVITDMAARPRRERLAITK